MLKSLLMAGIITSDEAKSAEEKLAVCGLNEDRSDEALSVTALNLALEHPSELWEEIMLKNIETGAISEAEAEKIRGFLKDLLKD
ncbi:MAG: hypothetical protein HYT63_00485 [Candidatus Yanofskybacteria bacterium]|nr:hypothetical protein [Candidatus Yanofskybacteria bacterium]